MSTRWQSSCALAGMLVLCAMAVSGAQSPYLVADINQTPINGSALPEQSFSPLHAVDLGGVLYFAAADAAHGSELWRSDGTSEGTWRVADIRPGSEGSSIAELFSDGKRLYFLALDGELGNEVWTSDGTRQGTRLLRDICPGSCASRFDSAAFTAWRGLVFFLANPSYANEKLWVTDGTREGTRLVFDPLLVPGRLEGPLVSLPDALLFTLRDNNNQISLWRTDGTSLGTSRLDFNPGASLKYLVYLTPAGHRAFFWASEEPLSTKKDLWVTDGTPAGTFEVRPDSAPWMPAAWNDLLFYFHDGDLWRSDGTPAGTYMVRNFGPGFRVDRITSSACGALFWMQEAATGRFSVWSSQGSTATTRQLWQSGPEGFLVDLRNAADRAFFLSREGSSLDLWEVAGDTCQARHAAVLCGAQRSCLNSGPPHYLGYSGQTHLIGTGARVCFNLHLAETGSELWCSDGSEAGTALVRDIHSDPGSAVAGIATLGRWAVFSARSHYDAAFLWRSDGTAARTKLINTRVAWPQSFVRDGSRLWFIGADSANPLLRRGLWTTDATSGGTAKMAEIFNLGEITPFGPGVFFSANSDINDFQGSGNEPWISNGTPAGTHLLVDINRQIYFPPFTSPPIAGSSSPTAAVRLGSQVLFTANDGFTGRELWATDGTAPGTRLVLDIDPRVDTSYGEVRPYSSYPGAPVRLGGVVLFAAEEETAGRELWRTDGTPAGTRLVRDLLPGSAGSSPHDLVALGGKVYFLAETGTGEGLWRTDGTAAGTVLIRRLTLQGVPSQGQDLTVAGNRLFFVVRNEMTGPELFVSDGTFRGTRLLELRPGPKGSYPQALTAIGGKLLFAADDGETGLEPWVSDGTPRGTRRLGDLAPGPNASSPSSFTATDKLLFFGADDGTHGRELWALPLAGL